MKKVIHFYYFFDEDIRNAEVNDLMDVIVYEEGIAKIDYNEGAVYQYVKNKRNYEDVGLFLKELEGLAQPLGGNGEVQTTIKITEL